MSVVGTLRTRRKSLNHGHFKRTRRHFIRLQSAESETAIFKIGGVEIPVPALTLDVLLQVKTEIRALGPDMDAFDYGAAVIKIVAASLRETRPELTPEVLMKFCSWPELTGLSASMNKLLEVSGLGEAPAAAGAPRGTGTLTDSPQNLPSEGSAQATQ